MTTILIEALTLALFWPAAVGGFWLLVMWGQP